MSSGSVMVAAARSGLEWCGASRADANRCVGARSPRRRSARAQENARSAPMLCPKKNAGRSSIGASAVQS